MAAKADWYSDPTTRFERRYWDGNAWTEHVYAKGEQSVDSEPVTLPTQSTNAAAGTTVEPSAITQDAGRKVPLFGARKAAREAHAEIDRLSGLIDKHGLKSVAERDALLAELAEQIAAASAELERTKAAVAASQAERADIQSSILDLRGARDLQDMGLFDFEHPAEASTSLATELESVRSQIKQLAREGSATVAAANFTFNNSSRQGDKFVRDMSRLMLRSYNAEAENGVKAVRAGNLPTAQKRLSTAAEQVAKLGAMVSLSITPEYHRLRLRELELAARHLQAKQAEKELERERRAELREQKRAEEELAREKARLEKERAHYENVLEKLVASGDEEGAERMRAQIADAQKAIEDVDYRAANIRAGYVYVISNVGSFGPEVVKIGMTRRLEPMDRVTELGDASVPFRFDVHALFFADDAVAIESTLHRHFASKRINKVNLRREYFQTTPAEVLRALEEHHVEVLEYTVEPAAPEYRDSVALAEHSAPTTT